MSDFSQYNHRLLNVLAGAPRSGKSYLSEYLANKYPNTVLVYNWGKDSDFNGFEVVSFLSYRDTLKLIKSKEQKREYKEDPKILFFRYNRKNYPINIFCEMMKGKKMRCKRLGKKSELLFYQSIFYYMKDMLVVFDDMGAQTKSGCPENMRELLSRSNHTGSYARQTDRRTRSKLKAGVDIFCLYHNLEKVTTEIFDYCTYIFMFKTAKKPQPPELEKDPELKEVIGKSYEGLKDMVKHSFSIITMPNAGNISVSFKNPI